MLINFEVIKIFDKNSLTPRAVQHRFMFINRMHRAIVESRMKATGIHRSQHMILMYLYRCNDKTSQKDIAKLLGTTQQVYSRYENGTNEIPIRHLITLARFYNVSMDYIVGETDSPQKHY